MFFAKWVSTKIPLGVGFGSHISHENDPLKTESPWDSNTYLLI